MEINSTSLSILAIIAAVILAGAVTVEIISILDAEARGCKNSRAFNASQGRCFHP
jgi:hypothetical protein